MSALYAFSVVHDNYHTPRGLKQHTFIYLTVSVGQDCLCSIEISVLTTVAFSSRHSSLKAATPSTCMIITNILLVRIKSHFPHTLNGRIVLSDVNTRGFPNSLMCLILHLKICEIKAVSLIRVSLRSVGVLKLLLEKFGDEGDVLISYSLDSLNLLYPEQHAEVSCEICFFPFLSFFFNEILLFPSKI